MHDIDMLLSELRDGGFGGRTLVNTPMATETSFSIGGPADLLLLPDSANDVEAVVRICADRSVPLTVLGGATNVLVRDGGIRGAVMKLDGLNSIRRDGVAIISGAGAKLADVCAFAMEEGLSGLEFACGIPGSAGGAVYMNAGAYDGEIKDVVVRSVSLDRNGGTAYADCAGHAFGYRKSIFQDNGHIIIETVFQLAQSHKSIVNEKMDEYCKRRLASQPIGQPSAGSVFRRPRQAGAYVGPMIEACGLKGAKVGGAQVSEKHTGFIVNTGGATAADVVGLIDIVKSAVKSKFGIELETEIRIIGEG